MTERVVDDQGWDSFYGRGGAAPWENGGADLEMVGRLEKYVGKGGRVLDVGCGRGVNAVALARRGYGVVGVEIAKTALAGARQAGAAAGVQVEWRLEDFVKGTGDVAAFEGVMDRAVFHVMGEEGTAFAKRVASVLKEGGVWVSVCGSCDDPTVGSSFPKVTMGWIAGAVEEFFMVEAVERVMFLSASGKAFWGWVCVFRKRAAGTGAAAT